MRRSETALFTRRHGPGWENETAELTVRAGLVRQFASGSFGFTPTGQRVKRRLEALIRRELRAIGGREISLPQLTPRSLWEASGRWENFEGEMLTLTDRADRDRALAPSHEEGVVHLVEGTIRSTGALPALFFQLETKHRDDHPRNGLCRTTEFTMADAYSLHASRASLETWYERVRGAYERIFDALDLEVAVVEVEDELMGGPRSAEFVAPVDAGSEALVACDRTGCRVGATAESPRQLNAGDACPDCAGTLRASEGIEVGHVFQLGTRYSASMGLAVDGPDGESVDVEMGSYGIGVDRLLHTLLAQGADDAGCRWPETPVGPLAPYRLSIVPLVYDGEFRAVADRLHDACGPERTLLFDDPDQSIGERFAESDLLGVPWKVVIGNHYRETGEVDLETRDGESRSLAPGAVAEVVEP